MFTNIARWQKQQKRWTDGEFLTLESEAISSELDDLFRETYKSNKTFETRRKQAAEKAPKKPKGKELTKRQKLYNHLLSKKRIVVENVIRRCKIFRITKDVYRGKHKNHGKVWNLVAGLVNLRYGESLA